MIFFGGVNLMCTFRGDVVWIFSSIWSHVNEKEKKNRKKRPRVLDVLLGHFLVKRVPVTYQLSSIKDPWIFQSKVDTGSSKTRNAPNDPKLTLNTLTFKGTLYMYQVLTPETEILFRFTLRLPVSEIHAQGQRKSEMHRRTLNRTWTLNSQKYPIYTKCLPLRPPFSPFRSSISHFRDTTCTRSAKIVNAPNDPKLTFKHLTVKRTLYTLNIYPRDPHFGPFRSMISHFWDTTCTRSAKIANALNNPKLNLNT